MFVGLRVSVCVCVCVRCTSELQCSRELQKKRKKSHLILIENKSVSKRGA